MWKLILVFQKIVACFCELITISGFGDQSYQGVAMIFQAVVAIIQFEPFFIELILYEPSGHPMNGTCVRWLVRNWDKITSHFENTKCRFEWNKEGWQCRRDFEMRWNECLFSKNRGWMKEERDRHWVTDRQTRGWRTDRKERHFWCCFCCWGTRCTEPAFEDAIVGNFCCRDNRERKMREFCLHLKNCEHFIEKQRFVDSWHAIVCISHENPSEAGTDTNVLRRSATPKFRSFRQKFIHFQQSAVVFGCFRMKMQSWQHTVTVVAAHVQWPLLFANRATATVGFNNSDRWFLTNASKVLS